eukprot:Amastigsp_a513521_6.p3 type:complete len:124 gc:universal Amastigsp_a513521_6:119-490(+)
MAREERLETHHGCPNGPCRRASDPEALWSPTRGSTDVGPLAHQRRVARGPEARVRRPSAVFCWPTHPMRLGAWFWQDWVPGSRSGRHGRHDSPHHQRLSCGLEPGRLCKGRRARAPRIGSHVL